MLVDDDAGVRQALQQKFARDERLAVVSEHACARDAIQHLTDMPTKERPDIALLDIKMRGMDGIECCHRMREQLPNLVIAMFTGRSVRDYFDPARLAGADAFIVKSTTLEQLAVIARQLRRHAGECRCIAPNESEGGIIPQLGFGALTRCETRVVKLIADGLIQKEIAVELGCSLRNVHKLIKSAKNRLGARSLGHLISICPGSGGGS